MLAGFRYRNNTVVKTGLLILKFLVLNLVKVYLWALRSPFFYALYDTHNPSSPDLSQNTKPVATTPTIIWLISWYQPKISVPLHQ